MVVDLQYLVVVAVLDMYIFLVIDMTYLTSQLVKLWSLMFLK